MQYDPGNYVFHVAVGREKTDITVLCDTKTGIAAKYSGAMPIDPTFFADVASIVSAANGDTPSDLVKGMHDCREKSWVLSIEAHVSTRRNSIACDTHHTYADESIDLYIFEN